MLILYLCLYALAYRHKLPPVRNRIYRIYFRKKRGMHEEVAVRRPQHLVINIEDSVGHLIKVYRFTNVSG